MSEQKWNPEQLAQLLQLAAQKQGVSEQKLEEQLTQSPQAQQLLQNPEKLRSLLERPEIAELLRRLKGTE